MALSYDIRHSSISLKIKFVLYLVMIASAFAFFLSGSTAAAAPLSPPTEAQIVVKIDKDRYDLGDVMVVSGEVQSVVVNTPLTIQILDSNNNLIHVEQITVATDGRFSLPIKIEGPLWSVPGKYYLVVQYGFKHISTMVDFQFEQVNVPTDGMFNVQDLSSGQNFDLNYTITGGQVKSMAIDQQDLALVVKIDSTSSGSLHLKIPRLLLDAKKSSNADESFLVFVDDDEITSFQEPVSDYQYRVLDIPITSGDSKIEIIGTIVIPEFENISGIVLVLAVGLVTISTVLLRTRMNQNLLHL